MLRPSNPSRAALVLLSAGLVVTFCLAGVWLWMDLGRTLEARTTVRSALLRWQEVYGRWKDAESAARGYVIAGDAHYLISFERVADRFPGLWMEVMVAEGAVKDGLPIEKIDEIQKLLHTSLGRMQEMITVTQREGSERGSALFRQAHGREGLESLESVETALDRRLTELDARFVAVNGQLENALSTGGRGLLGLVIAALLATGASGLMFRQALAQARRSAQLSVEKQKADLANREKSVFLATMSHEIRTPMNAILGFGELLLADARDDKQKRYATSIVRGGQSLLQLINDVLDFSKIEAGMLDFELKPMDVRELADFTRELFAHQCDQKGVAFEVEVEEGIPGSLMLDEARLRQIVINLVGNAIKFTPAGTVWLRFRAGAAGASVSVFPLIVEVSDTGVGIPADQLEPIFEPFVQTSANREMGRKGTGLGLAIVKRLTNMMGGLVFVRSEAGRGSTFTVELPKVEVSARLPAVSVLETRFAVDFNGLRPSGVLVVDDNPENLLLVRGFFEGTHHAVGTAINGRAALEYLNHRDRPDVVLMDIRMPVMDGRAALEEMRKRPDLGLLPVIAVTASSLPHEEEELRGAFDGYLRKPFSRAQLFAELAQFIPPCPPAVLTAGCGDGPVPAAWKPLARRLRQLEQTRWPVVRDAMVMSEVAEFAIELRGLAANSDCPPLEHLAGRLLREAESFSFASLEKTLAAFPELTGHIEERAGATSL